MGILTQPPVRGAILVAFLALPAASLVRQPVSAQEPSPEYQIKAAFLLNFARYIEWPGPVFPTDESPLTLCVLEPNPFGTALARTVEGERVQGHAIIVQSVAALAQVGRCHLLFIPESARGRAASVIAQVESVGTPTATVGEFPGFIDAGGVINLLTVGDRVRFEVNVGAAERRGLRVSSRLLRLAVTVRRS